MKELSHVTGASHQGRRLSPGAVTAAFAVAVIADTIQLPLNLAFLTGWLAIPAEAVDLAIDAGVCILLSLLLGGFHFAFLPAVALEALPGVSMFPTWTVATAAVVWSRHGYSVESTMKTPTAPDPKDIAVRSVVTLSPNDQSQNGGY